MKTIYYVSHFPPGKGGEVVFCLFFQFRAEESRLSEPYAVKIDKNEKMLDFYPPEVYTQRIKIQTEE